MLEAGDGLFRFRVVLPFGLAIVEGSPMRLAHLFARNLCIDACRERRLVTQHILNQRKIASGFEDLGGKGMPE